MFAQASTFIDLSYKQMKHMKIFPPYTQCVFEGLLNVAQVCSIFTAEKCRSVLLSSCTGLNQEKRRKVDALLVIGVLVMA